MRDLLAAHLSHARTSTPSEFSFALEGEQLRDDDVTFFSARDDGKLLGVAALKRLDDRHVELKSMHTRAEARGRGVGRALVEHLTDFARTAGYERISLETGTSDAFMAIDLDTGTIRTVAGTGVLGLDPDDDRLATETMFTRPFGIELDPAGALYVADTINSRIVRIAP